MSTRDTVGDISKEIYAGAVLAALFSKINDALLDRQVRSLDDLCPIGDLAQSFNQDNQKEGQDLFQAKSRQASSG